MVFGGGGGGIFWQRPSGQPSIECSNATRVPPSTAATAATAAADLPPPTPSLLACSGTWSGNLALEGGFGADVGSYAFFLDIQGTYYISPYNSTDPIPLAVQILDYYVSQGGLESVTPCESGGPGKCDPM